MAERTPELCSLEQTYVLPHVGRAHPVPDMLRPITADDTPYLNIADGRKNRQWMEETFSTYRCRQLQDLAEQLASRGAKVVFGPSEEMMVGRFRVDIRATDFVVPVCHEGMNRSQVLYLLLHSLKRLAPAGKCPPLESGVCLPHGAESGFDPHQAYEDVTGDNFFGYIHGEILPRTAPGEWLHNEFYRVFGNEKAKRIGQDFAKLHRLALNPAEGDPRGPDFDMLSNHRTRQRLHMDGTLFSYPWLLHRSGAKKPEATDPPRRVVVFCFVRAAHIFMRRLLQSLCNQGLTFDNLVIVALPLPDNISSSGGKSEIREAQARGDMSASKESLSRAAMERTFAFYSSIIFLHAEDVDVKTRQMLGQAGDGAAHGTSRGAGTGSAVAGAGSGAAAGAGGDLFVKHEGTMVSKPRVGGNSDEAPRSAAAGSGAGSGTGAHREVAAEPAAAAHAARADAPTENAAEVEAASKAAAAAAADFRSADPTESDALYARTVMLEEDAASRSRASSGQGGDPTGLVDEDSDPPRREELALQEQRRAEEAALAERRRQAAEALRTAQAQQYAGAFPAGGSGPLAPAFARTTSNPGDASPSAFAGVHPSVPRRAASHHSESKLDDGRHSGRRSDRLSSSSSGSGRGHGDRHRDYRDHRDRR